MGIHAVKSCRRINYILQIVYPHSIYLRQLLSTSVKKSDPTLCTCTQNNALNPTNSRNFDSYLCSGGGSVDAIKFLLERGADPNTVGRFKRTPLYRAAFAGHLDAVQVRDSGCLLLLVLHSNWAQSNECYIFECLF